MNYGHKKRPLGKFGINLKMLKSEKILITGNMGYVGSYLTKYLKKNMTNTLLLGLDTGLFGSQLNTNLPIPEVFCDQHIFKDIRNIDKTDLKNIDKIVHLAAISNDPIGNQFETITNEINYEASKKLIQLACRSNVSHFVFASSCSVYGASDNKLRSEVDEVFPITAYAKSKIETEKFVLKKKFNDMLFTSLRFSTACGLSPRIRLDLAINDFVASAIVNKKIALNSNGLAWRPFIDVHDMSRAIHWALQRNNNDGGQKLIVNVGKNENNYLIKDLAEKIAKKINGVDLYLGKNSKQDKRSYKVDFTRYTELAKDFLPIKTIDNTIEDLIMNINVKNFDLSNQIRLNTINQLIKKNFISRDLKWLL